MTNKLGLKNWVEIEGSPGVYKEKPKADQTRVEPSADVVRRREAASARFHAKMDEVKAQIRRRAA
jgi:hypothetical protein